MSNTAPKPRFQGEIATTGDGRDITRGYSGPILPPSDPVLALRGGGDVGIYEQLLTDSQVGSCWQQRRLAVTGREWEVLPGGDSAQDKAAAEWLREQLDRVGWDAVTDKMLAGVFYGYAVAEIVYQREGQRIGIEAIKVRNRRRFRFTPQGELRLLTQSAMLEGEPAPTPYFWHFATGADHDDEPYGLGIAHWLYWPVLFKRNGIKFWLVFLEKFGMPTAVGKFDGGTKDEDINKLLAALEAIQTDSGIALPKSMEIDLLEAARSGTADYQALHNTMDATVAKVVLGQTASTQGTPGKLGSEDLQGEVRLDLIKADADLICESFNRGPACWLTEWNFPGARPPQVWRKVEVPEDLESRATRDKTISEIGFKPSKAYIRDTYGGDWEPVQPAAPAAGGGGGFFAEGDLDPIGEDATDGQRARLEREADAEASKWVEQMRTLIDRAETPEQLRELLAAEFDNLDAEAFALLLGDARAAAHLAGRFDILEGV